MNALVSRLALALALGASAIGALAAAHREKPFSYTADDSIDIAGVYQPVHEPFVIGHYKLDGIRVDSVQDFRLYEKEKRHSHTSAPIRVMFGDPSIVPADSDLTDDPPDYELYALPRSYRIENESIAFDGYHPKLGRVTFRGKLDRAAIKAANAQDSAVSDGSVLKGNLTVGGKLYSDVEFFWFNGDP
jgi:hypothetical protein